MIVTLELAPGAIVTEGALTSVGMGRTPVREAMQRLAWEGLMEIRPRSGIAIAALTPRDWRGARRAARRRERFWRARQRIT